MMPPGGSGKLEYSAWDGVQIMMNGLVCHSKEFELYPRGVWVEWHNQIYTLGRSLCTKVPYWTGLRGAVTR